MIKKNVLSFVWACAWLMLDAHWLTRHKEGTRRKLKFIFLYLFYIYFFSIFIINNYYWKILNDNNNFVIIWKKSYFLQKRKKWKVGKKIKINNELGQVIDVINPAHGHFSENPATVCVTQLGAHRNERLLWKSEFPGISGFSCLAFPAYAHPTK